MTAVPVVALLCAGVSATAVLHHGAGGSASQVLTTDQPASPAPTVPATTAPAAPKGAGPRVHHSLTQAATGDRGAGSAAHPRVSAAPHSVAPNALPVLAYADPSGDAVGAGTVDSSSQSSDITGMAFRATAAGLVLRMDLLGYQDTTHHYVASLHSARTGCDLQVVLDAAAPEATAVCSGATVWNRTLTPYADPTQVQVTLPWDSFPRQVSPDDLLTTSGQVTVATATGSGQVVTDSAADRRAVRFRGTGQ